jgi:carnitine 3-dehydrogenase / betainyl-CoA thioesterase
MADLPSSAALLGGGVIGGGWAARLLLAGVDVRLYDPAPDAGETVLEIVASARRAWRRLTLAPLPAEGTFSIAGSVGEAVFGAGFVQESAPEREGLKRALLAEADRAAAPTVVIASSTSGLLPSRLQADMERPGRMLVGHPFTPVYLLPLVELCAGSRTAPATVERAAAVYRALGMRPLVVRREVDAFIADRLLEALWREALWLVEDDIATVAEVDDAIRFGAGLRWAVMGTFLNYRIAGGKAGIRHFMEQFGPALELPWTRLTEVPELDEELLGKLVAQSDEQAAGRDLRELVRLRDDCLVDIMQALRTHATGAGAVLAAHERALLAAGGAGAATLDDAPLRLVSAVVAPEWIDYNGHAHESRYLKIFGDTTDALLRLIGIELGADATYYTVETHMAHLGQTRAGDRLTTTTQVLGCDAKRLHVFHTLLRGEDEVATAEQMLLHVDAAAARAAPAPAAVAERVERLARAHAGLPRPARAGRAIASPVTRDPR